jgi:D-threo-aldose 1-dehydrogenase
MITLPIGKTGLSVTPLCFGASGLGNMPDTYGYEVDDARARATLHAIFNSQVNFLDTANIYGMGRSEERIGAAIRERGSLPEGFVLSTKLDRDVDSGKFDADQVRRSIEESLTRLGLPSVPLLHLHDPEHARDVNEITRAGGALDELFKLKEEGIAQAVGLAMGRIDMMFPILRDWPFDALISHNRFTVLNRSAEAMFDYAQSQNIAVLNAAPYAGGILAKGSQQMPRVTYQPADVSTLSPVQAVESVCTRYGIPTGALALQFSMNDARITSTVVGVTKPERVEQTIDWAEFDIPSTVWEEIAALGFSLDDPEADRDYQPG